MKSRFLPFCCILFFTTTSFAQDQLDVSAWLTNVEINGAILQTLRAPADQLSGNTKYDIMGYQRSLDRFMQSYREGKEVVMGSVDTSYDFVRVQNPTWPLRYYQQEIEAYKAYNRAWKIQAIEKNNGLVIKYRDSLRLAALGAGQVFVQQPVVMLKEQPSAKSLTLGKISQYSYVQFNGSVENSDWIEITVGDKYTGYIMAGDVVTTLAELQAPADKLEKMRQSRLYSFEPGAAYQARLNKQEAAEAAQLKAMNSAPQRKLIRGPKGGCYFINSNGNKQYVDRSLCK